MPLELSSRYLAQPEAAADADGVLARSGRAVEAKWKSCGCRNRWRRCPSRSQGISVSADEMWAQNFCLRLPAKQAYLLASNHLLDSVNKVEGIDAHSAKRRLYLRQYIDAMSPTNSSLPIRRY